MSGETNESNKAEQWVICKWLVNNQKFSDVQFMVGPTKELVYAHKLILASGSPVFEKYFYADYDHKWNGEPIDEPDLSAVGFINMIKFFYGYEVSELNVSEVIETYQAADKYLANNDLNDKLLQHMNTMLDASNCCLIYDQLLKLKNVDVLQLSYVRKIIQHNTKQAFKSESFTEIDFHTLVGILELDNLNIDEIDVLKSCLRWTEMECSRKELLPDSANLREMFEPLKHLICFSNLSIEQLKEFDQIEKLLNNDEISSLVIHLFNKSKKLAIECKPTRNTCQLYAVEDFGESYFHQHGNIELLSEISFMLKVNHHVSIKSINTHLRTNGSNLSLLIIKYGKQINLKSAEAVSCNGKWIFQFEEYVEIQPNQDYKLIFKFNDSLFDNANYKLSKKTELLTELSLVKYHCIAKMEFYAMPLD